MDLVVFLIAAACLFVYLGIRWLWWHIKYPGDGTKRW